VCLRGLAAVRSPAPVPPAEAVVAAWAYEGVPRALVLALKIRGLRPAAAPLAAGMVAAARSAGLRGAILVWVPGRRADMRRRGFDHAELLARTVAGELGLPARPVMTRLGRTPDQACLSRTARRRNLVGAFGARPCSGPVVLVDDVVTTGATVDVCARALLAAGASSVEALAPCRA
jgi:predicted amidophosphoribosyltransferase